MLSNEQKYPRGITMTCGSVFSQSFCLEQLSYQSSHSNWWECHDLVALFSGNLLDWNNKFDIYIYIYIYQVNLSWTKAHHNVHAPVLRSLLINYRLISDLSSVNLVWRRNLRIFASWTTNFLQNIIFLLMISYKYT